MPAVSASKYTVTAGWDDVPHLTEKTKAELLASTQPHLREARSKGIPSLGVGAIYPIAEAQIICAPFAIPAHWKRGYGLDVGWSKTAGVWLAQDPSDARMYAYTEHAQGEAKAIVHATSIKSRGEWIKGAIDTSANGRSPTDGEKLRDQYEAAGLHLVNAVKAVDAGIHLVLMLLSTGQLKLFSTLSETLREYRLYHRDEKGKIVKKDDHCLDALRYGVMTWEKIGSVKPADINDISAVFRPADGTAGY